MSKMKRYFYHSASGRGETVVSLLVMCLAVSICLCGCRGADPVGSDTSSASLEYTSSAPTPTAEPMVTNDTDQITPDFNRTLKHLVESPDPDNPAVIRRGGPEIDISNVLWSGSGSMSNLVELHYFNWQGKMVYEPLYQLLENGYTRIGGIIGGIKTEKDGEEPVYAIIGNINEFQFAETGNMECYYTYNGKTINEYKAEYHKYWELISDPQTRDENMSYFNVAKAAYNEAEQYFVQQSIDFQQKTLLLVQEFCTQKGISSEIIKRSDKEQPVFVCDGCGYYIIIYATASQFAELDLASCGLGNEFYMIFSWATQSNRRGILNGIKEL